MLSSPCVIHPPREPYFIIHESYINVAKQISKKNFACIAAFLNIYEDYVNNRNGKEWQNIFQPCSSAYFRSLFFGYFSEPVIDYSFKKLINSGCFYYSDKSRQTVVFDVLQVQSLICSSNKEYFTT
jgi:hypothetical protein